MINLSCSNDIIKNDLIINIDLSNIESWNLNTGLTVTSISNFNGAVSDNINLINYGLTGFDVGAVNCMWDNIKLTSKDSIFKMNRIAYNVIDNPSTSETSGVTVTTSSDLYPISAVTSGVGGNYFELGGGYLHGYFKLDDYKYEVLPSRYGKGITIESLIYVYPNSSGIFYFMGVRSEDKYNPHFSGETISGASEVTGVFSSDDNYLDSFMGKKRYKDSFKSPEDKIKIVYSEPNQVDNIKNNVIAFEITNEGKLGYKYINNEGLIINDSSNHIMTNTGFTLISTTFSPYNILLTEYDLRCGKQRFGVLDFYVNGRCIWKIKDFPEFYFRGLNNNKEKQIGVPYNIGWGGGSFGLRHSWHYEFQKYELCNLYDNDVTRNFSVVNNPLEYNGETPISEFVLTNDNSTFIIDDTSTPITVMKIEYTGSTNMIIKSCYIKYDIPISTISNREYVAKLELFNGGLLKQLRPDNISIHNKISILPYSDDVDISITDDLEYVYPLNSKVVNYITGLNEWIEINVKYLTEDNSGQQFISLGILIETDYEFNLDLPLYIKSLTYEGADILVQDVRKDNLLIEQNFGNSFIGGIQKLRIYNNALSSPEILHNAMIESRNNDNIKVTQGGRIIYK